MNIATGPMSPIVKDRDDFKAIRRSLAQLVAAKDTHRAESSLRVSHDIYTDPIRWEAERALLRTVPQLAGLSIQIQQAGDVLTFDHVGPQIMVIRQEDGGLKAFLNMCTHRAARIVQDCGRIKRLTCPFHAWTFGLDGKLKAVPGKEFFDAAMLGSRDLIEVPVAEWAGLIFVRATAGGDPIVVEDWLGGYADHVKDFDLANAAYIDTGRLEVRTNWKYAIDTFSENYHLPALHTSSFGLDYVPNLLHYDAFGPHHRFALANKSFRATVGCEEAKWNDPDVAVIGFIFPNLILSMAPTPTGRHNLQLTRVYPGSAVDRTFSLTMTVALPGADSEEDIAFARATHDNILIINAQEDYLLAADAQRNLQFAPEDFMVLYASIEPAVQDFHRHLADALNMPMASGTAR
ncbi:Phenylpropionate dioxygenase, large terminal subunit [Sphingobium faniae]|nr:Phenylpropionate dioxygenase, large terminal subunit [Sphingobium faniae]